MGNNQGLNNSRHALRRAVHGPGGLLIEGKQTMTSETYEPGMVPASYRYEDGNFIPIWGSLGSIWSPIRSRAEAMDDTFTESRGNPAVFAIDDARQLACDVMRVCWITFRKSDPRMKNLVLNEGTEGLFPSGGWQELEISVFESYDTETYADYASRLHDLADVVSKVSAYDMTVSDMQRIGDLFRAIFEATYEGAV